MLPPPPTTTHLTKAVSAGGVGATSLALWCAMGVPALWDMLRATWLLLTWYALLVAGMEALCCGHEQWQHMDREAGQPRLRRAQKTNTQGPSFARATQATHRIIRSSALLAETGVECADDNPEHSAYAQASGRKEKEESRNFKQNNAIIMCQGCQKAWSSGAWQLWMAWCCLLTHPEPHASDASTCSNANEKGAHIKEGPHVDLYAAGLFCLTRGLACFIGACSFCKIIK